MRFDGNSTLRTAFAIIAIESIWPNPQGGELSADAYDLNLLGLEEEGGFGKSKGIPRKSFATPSSSYPEYYASQGYYKIIPLNVLSAKTTTSSGSGSGSTFEVKFTLDDLLMVTSRDNAESIVHATGLPLNRSDLGGIDTTPDFLYGSNMEFKTHTDEELGLTRYRVSGVNSGFNIEDLVSANDTITIWFYHDPSEFYYRDNIVDQSTLSLDRGMSWVVGSGDRRGQYNTETPTFKGFILGSSGLLDEYREDLMSGLEEGQTRLIRGVSKDNLFDVLDSFYMEARSGAMYTAKNERVIDYCHAAFGEDNGQRIYEWLIGPIIEPRDPKEEGDSSEVQFRARRSALRTLIDALSPNEDKDSPLLFNVNTPTAEQVDAARIIAGTPEQVFSLIQGLNLFSAEMNTMLTEYATTEAKRGVVVKSSQNLSTGRTVITAGDKEPSHGETPYLVLKGQISDVSSVVGTVQNSHTITITGSGMEKILKEHEVYYEDTFLPDGQQRAMTDFKYFYVYMSPPRAILSIVNTWAPKKIIYGRPTSWTIDSFQTLWLNGKLPKKEDYEDGVNETETEPQEPEGASQDGTQEEEETTEGIGRITFKEKRIPIRGNIVAEKLPWKISEELEAANPELRRQSEDSRAEGDATRTRVFSPVNYVDTTRVREMITVLDRSYSEPEVESVINTAIQLQTRTSVMANLTNMIGVGELYEIFVDETGRIRYRLSFEAMERTPQPLYTPIVQDIDVLGDGATFGRNDSMVTTMVDVTPLRNQSIVSLTSVGFVGRSLPEATPVPITDIPEEVEDVNISSDLFRYGLRTKTINDIYTAEPWEARRKAVLYRGFFSSPVKTAQIRVAGNTSFRAGESVLVCLQTAKHRSRVPIDMPKMVEWLKAMKEDPDLLDMYIGVDERLLHPEYYSKTSSFMPIPSTTMHNEFVSDPKNFIADQFIATFEYLMDTLPSIDIITPDYFPSTYWFARYAGSDTEGSAFAGWDRNAVYRNDTLDLHTAVLRATLLGDSSAADDVKKLYITSPGLINSLKFQDFRCASYLISGVSHSFVQDADMSTTLSLNYGQDTLVLLEPKNFLPIGFLSIEKKMRIGYNNPDQQFMYESYPDKMSAMQKMYFNQFKEDMQFKRGNFLYTAQGYRNTSNYMYEISQLEGAGYGVSSVGSIDRESYNETPRTTPVDMKRVDEVVAAYEESALHQAAVDSRRVMLEEEEARAEQRKKQSRITRTGAKNLGTAVEDVLPDDGEKSEEGKEDEDVSRFSRRGVI